MAEEELQHLTHELEAGKKKKKKKIALDFVAAETACLVASGGSEEHPSPPSPSTPQLEEESQRAGVTPIGVTEPGMEEHHDHEIELLEEKLKNTGLESLEHSAVTEPVTTSHQLISSTVNPTTVTDQHWVYAKAPHAIRSSEEAFGKWLVFKKVEELDETWHMIRRAVESGELGALCVKCSTATPDPSSYPTDPGIKGVICVYTSEKAIDEVGFKLIYLVKQNIRYKTEEATRQGLYTLRGYTKVTLKALYWNDGEPSFEKKARDFKGYSWRGGRHRNGHTMGDWRQGMRDEGERNLPPREGDSQGGYHYRGRRGYDHYCDRRPPRRYERGSHHRDSYDDRGPPRRYDEDHHRDPYGDHGPPRRYDEDHHRDPYDDRGPPRRYDEGHHHRDPYGDHGPPRRYDEGHHHRDPYGDHGPPRRYDEGHHHRDPYDDRGPPRRYDEGHHHRDPYDDRGPPRRYDEGLHHHDPYGDHGPPRRYDEGHHHRDPYGSDGYHPQQRSLEGHREWDRRRDELSKERPRLQLQPRTKPPEDTSGRRGGGGGGGRASSSIFGQAKPVDTAARDRGIEERLLRERAETEEMGDRSLTDEGGKRGGRTNESWQRERTDRRGRYDSSGRGERGERGDRSDQGERGGRGDRSGRGERGERYDRSERGERRGRHDSSGQRKRRERSTSDSSDRGERRDGKRPPRDDCHDTTEATGWGGRRRESYEEEEERASEPGRGRWNDDPASPTKK